MQIIRNNDMGLIVTKEEKRWSIFGVVSWRKKKNNFNSSGNCDGQRVCESQSENCNPIQGYLKLSWLLQLIVQYDSNLFTTKYQEVRIFCKGEICLSPSQQISYLCVRFIGRSYVFNFFSQTNLYQNNQCLLCRNNGRAKLQELNQFTFMQSVMSSNEISAAWLRSLFASWGEMLSSAALLIRLSFSLCDLRYDTLDNKFGMKFACRTIMKVHFRLTFVSSHFRLLWMTKTNRQTRQRE